MPVGQYFVSNLCQLDGTNWPAQLRITRWCDLKLQMFNCSQAVVSAGQFERLGEAPVAGAAVVE